VATGGFSAKRLARVRNVLERHVDAGFVLGAVAISGLPPIRRSMTDRPAPSPM
jgi:hypothetical protein